MTDARNRIWGDVCVAGGRDRIANLIVWKRIQIEHRQPLLGDALLMADGISQNEEKVIHIVARRLQDFTPMPGGEQTGSRDFH